GVSRQKATGPCASWERTSPPRWRSRCSFSIPFSRECSGRLLLFCRGGLAFARGDGDFVVARLLCVVGQCEVRAFAAGYEEAIGAQALTRGPFVEEQHVLALFGGVVDRCIQPIAERTAGDNGEAATIEREHIGLADAIAGGDIGAGGDQSLVFNFNRDFPHL